MTSVITSRNSKRKPLNLRDQINSEIDRLKAAGVRSFCPADVGKLLKTDARTVVTLIRDRVDVVQLTKCTSGYKRSTWGFRAVSA